MKREDKTLEVRYNDAEARGNLFRLLYESLREFISYRELLWHWALRDIKVRYKQTIFGVAWAIIQPFCMMIIFTLIFGKFAKISSDGFPYPVFSYVALVPWTFFSHSVNTGSMGLVSNISLVTKAYFPKEILVLAPTLAYLIDFAIAETIFIGLALYFHVDFHATIFWLPVLVFLQLFFTWAVGLFLATLNVFYRDVKYALSLLMQIWMYATPIVYPLSQVPANLRNFYLLNPMAGIINGYRQIFLQGQSPGGMSFLLTTGGVFLLFIVAYLFFKRLELKFADII